MSSLQSHLNGYSAQWRLFVTYRTEAKALAICERYMTATGIKPDGLAIVPHHDGGFVASFRVHAAAPSWPEAVVAHLALVQTCARSVTLTGHVSDELVAWSTEVAAPGIRAVDVVLRRSG